MSALSGNQIEDFLLDVMAPMMARFVVDSYPFTMFKKVNLRCLLGQPTK